MRRLISTLVACLFFALTALQGRASTGIEKAIAVPLTTLAGRELEIRDFRGKKPVYLKFWATWCRTCLEEMPHLENIYRQYGDRVEVIAVNIGINDDETSVRGSRQKLDLTVPVLIDTTGLLSQGFSMRGTPWHVLLDRNMQVIHTGHKATPELDRKIRLLATATAGSRAGTQEPASTGAESVPESVLEGSVALFFLSTWCDWYLEESRPDMARECIAAQRRINSLYTDFSGISWHGAVSRLWTGEEELARYRERLDVKHPLRIDTDNTLYLEYGIQHVPTLLLLKNGRVVYRSTDPGNDPGLRHALETLGDTISDTD